MTQEDKAMRHLIWEARKKLESAKREVEHLTKFLEQYDPQAQERESDE